MGEMLDLHAAADILTLTTTAHADGLGSHLLSRLLSGVSYVARLHYHARVNWGEGEGRNTHGLLGVIGLGDVHLLDLGLVDFLGRHVD
jgi:hypothetical protein